MDPATFFAEREPLSGKAHNKELNRGEMRHARFAGKWKGGSTTEPEGNIPVAVIGRGSRHDRLQSSRRYLRTFSQTSTLPSFQSTPATQPLRKTLFPTKDGKMTKSENAELITELIRRIKSLAERRAMPALGDSYTKIKKIGAGAFGAAWLIKRKKDGASLVCKEVQMRGVSSKEKQSIKQEVEVLRKLKHTNIIALYDAFEDTSGVLNIIMELGDGGDLDKFLKNQKGTRLPEEKIVDLFAQICSGLAYVHRQRILHRDIKGANILLTKKGEVKLCDFGVARVLSEDTNMALTQIGTPYYLSPEVCQGRPYDDKSDVWSLGVVLYELCALRRPFEADGMPALIIKIVRGKHAPIPSNYSRELKHLIEITIRVSPAERASVDDLMSSPAVQRFLHASKEKDQQRAPPAKPRSAEAQPSSRRPPAANGVLSGAPRPRSNEGPTTNQAAQAARAAAALLAPPQRRVGAGYSPGGGAPAGGASPGGGGRPTIAQLGGGVKPGAAGAKAGSPIGAAAAAGGAGRASRPVARPVSGTRRPSREGSSEAGDFVDKGDVSRLPKNVISAHDESDVMARDLARLLKK